MLLIYWAIIRLISKNRFLIRSLPFIVFVVLNSILILFMTFGADLAVVASIFSWIFIVPLSLIFGIIYILSYSQTILINHQRKHPCAILIGLGWFIHAIPFVSIRWILATDYLYFQLGLSLAYLLIFIGKLLYFKGEKSIKVKHKPGETEKFEVGEKEWEVKFM